MGNVLESVTASEVPYVGQIKDIIAECGGYPLMSGSGPTVFGLFDDEENALAAYDLLKEGHLAKQIYLTKFFNTLRRQEEDHAGL